MQFRRSREISGQLGIKLRPKVFDSILTIGGSAEAGCHSMNRVLVATAAPAMFRWGLIILTLLLLAGGKTAFGLGAGRGVRS